MVIMSNAHDLGFISIRYLREEQQLWLSHHSNACNINVSKTLSDMGTLKLTPVGSGVAGSDLLIAASHTLVRTEGSCHLVAVHMG